MGGLKVLLVYLIKNILMKQEKLTLDLIKTTLKEFDVPILTKIDSDLYRFGNNEFAIISTEKGMNEIDQQILKDLSLTKYSLISKNK